MNLLKIVILFSLTFLGVQLQGQEIQYVELGVNGLHCSACSFTVEKALKKVDGVSVVQMDLNERSGKVYFAENQAANFPALAKAITDAGYSIRFLEVQLQKEWAIGEQCQLWDFCLPESSRNSDRFQLFGQKYLPKKEWKNLKSNIPKQLCDDCSSTSFIRPLST